VQDRSRLGSSLAQAVGSQDLQRVKTLVSDDGDVNAWAYVELPCLHRAALRESGEIMLSLLANGVDPPRKGIYKRRHPETNLLPLAACCRALMLSVQWTKADVKRRTCAFDFKSYDFMATLSVPSRQWIT